MSARSFPVFPLVSITPIVVDFVQVINIARVIDAVNDLFVNIEKCLTMITTKRQSRFDNDA